MYLPTGLAMRLHSLHELPIWVQQMTLNVKEEEAL